MSTEMGKAFYIWRQICQLDPRDAEIRAANQLPKVESKQNWLKLCREGQWLTQEEIGRRLEMTKDGYCKIESKEIKGKITIEALREAAAAMDCELVYCVRPKSRKLFSEILWNQTVPRAFEIYKRRTGSEKIKPLILGKLAAWLATHTKFRREKGWVQMEKRFRN
jgi:transcriptional regulator with XRE-family HTH domain